jgi:lipopolysaccharide biosynthesis glycosyltransferase
MLVPAFFVAMSIKKASAKADAFDTVLLVPPGDCAPDQAAYAAANGIIIDESVDLSAIEGIPILQNRLSPATLFKLLLAGHFRDRYRRIVYLDADLTIHGDVAMLFRLDMKNFAVAAVPTGRVWLDKSDRQREEMRAHFEALGMTPPYRYFNTGVMVIDTERWAAEKLGDRTLAFLRKNSEICLLPDEDALNGVIDGQLLEISPVWNLRIEQVPSTRYLPVIIHYAGPDKPWRRFDRLFAFRDGYRLYEEFIAQTPWPGWLRSIWTMEDVVDCLKREAATLISRIKTRSPLRDPARKAAFDEELREYHRSIKFADVEQGLVVKREGRLELV